MFIRHRYSRSCSTAYNNSNADDSHGPLIPILVVILYWCKRKELLALPLKDMVAGRFDFYKRITPACFWILDPATIYSDSGVVHRSVGIDGFGLGARLVAARFFPFLAFYFFDSAGTAWPDDHFSIATTGFLDD